MYYEYESADFARRKPMTARTKQTISRALKGKRKRRRGMSLTGRTAVGKAVRALGATAAIGGAGLLARRAIVGRAMARDAMRTQSGSAPRAPRYSTGPSRPRLPSSSQRQLPPSSQRQLPPGSPRQLPPQADQTSKRRRR